MPKISVIIPFYNAEQYLDECILSLYNQTEKDFEIVLINDGSTDNSLEKIEKYLDQKNIKLLNNPTNLGVSISRNIAQNSTDSEFVAVMDADDICLQSRFGNSLNFFIENPDISLIGTQYVQFGNVSDNVLLPTEYDAIKIYLMFQCVICHPSVMYRRNDLFGKNIFYKNEFITAHDYDLYTNCIINNLKIINLSTRELNYRVHSGGITGTKSALMANESNEIRRRYIPRLITNINNMDLEGFLYILSGQIPKDIEHFLSLSINYAGFYMSCCDVEISKIVNLKEMVKNIYRRYFLHLQANNFINTMHLNLLSACNKSFKLLVSID